jgi:methyl-accepting chemotaxis protein
MLFGVGTLVVLLAGAVGGAVLLIVGLERDTADLADRHVRYATSIQQAALSAKGIANNERGFLISGDPNFVEELDERAFEAQQAFAAAEQSAVGAREREAAEEARVGFERWLRAVRRELAVYRAGFSQRAIRTSLGPTRDLRLTYEGSLARAQRLGLRSIEVVAALADSALEAEDTLRGSSRPAG